MHDEDGIDTQQEVQTREQIRYQEALFYHMLIIKYFREACNRKSGSTPNYAPFEPKEGQAFGQDGKLRIKLSKVPMKMEFPNSTGLPGKSGSLYLRISSWLKLRFSKAGSVVPNQ